jgi:hypothetical protein
VHGEGADDALAQTLVPVVDDAHGHLPSHVFSSDATSVLCQSSSQPPSAPLCHRATQPLSTALAILHAPRPPPQKASSRKSTLTRERTAHPPLQKPQ